MTTEVIVTDEWTAWFENLTEIEQEKVAVSVGLLEERGTTLGRPHSGKIEGSSIALRELITQVHGTPLRSFYAFDPARQGVLLIGGDKTGDSRFYERMVPLAEKIWHDYLEETEQSKK